jgi:predicted secreted protein
MKKHKMGSQRIRREERCDGWREQAEKVVEEEAQEEEKRRRRKNDNDN